MNNSENYFLNFIEQLCFKKTECIERFNPAGGCYELSGEIGGGYYWIYSHKNLFNIKIHDFYFNEDTVMEFNIPDCLSVTYYESISGEELSPYRRISAGVVKSFIGGEEPYKILVHGKIPICSVGIEILPAYYEDYLKKQYPDNYSHPISAFRSIDQTADFPEMKALLYEIKKYRGNGISAELFYESKVAEMLSLTLEHQKTLSADKHKQLSGQDIKQLECVTAYLNDHYASEVPLERLAMIACMGTTKLKTSFKQFHGCTITEYIQQRRMSQAEYLLAHTELTINQIAQTIGYSTSSRFAKLFQKSTGLLPSEYRKAAKK